jgi:hypothetical protein
MLTNDQAIRLGRMQERIYRCIEEELDRDPHHKSYEGALEITMGLPNIFSRGDGPTYTISLHAYVLSTVSGRHEHWAGKTLSDALAKAEQGIDDICQDYEFARFARQMDAMCDDDCEQAGGTTYGDNRHEAAQRIDARSDETPQEVQPERREPDPKDAPKAQPKTPITKEMER